MVRAPLDGGGGLVIVGHIGSHEDGAGHEAYAGNSGCRIAAGDSGHADSVVVHSPDNAGHVGPVPDIRHKVIAPVHEIISRAARSVFPHIGRQVRMAGPDALVHYAHNHVLRAACVIVPDTLDVDIGLRIAGVHEIPLPVQKRVVEGPGTHLFYRCHRQHSRNGGKTGNGFGHGNVRRVFHPVEAVQAFPAGTGLVFPGIGKYALQALDAQLLQDGIQGGRFGYHRACPDSFLYLRREPVVKLHDSFSAPPLSQSDKGLRCCRSPCLYRLLSRAGKQQDTCRQNFNEAWYSHNGPRQRVRSRCASGGCTWRYGLCGSGSRS